MKLIHQGLAIICLALVISHSSLSGQAESAIPYKEPWRPQFHFSPERNWMNDPNGMVFYEGEYHLFYQYNPFGDKWGHMSWGHAVSPDLVHWKHLPLALAEENGVMIFSGSAVVDWKNTSGFGKDGKPPMIAIYTGHYTEKPLQNQQIAYSNDRGRTWTKFAGNPVLDLGEKDFRDPKVFWHEPTKRWVMVVSWPVHRKVRFYSSPNLKNWTHLSDFGPGGSTSGIWECPDLFPIKIEGRRHAEKWALIVNVGSGAPAGGSGCQYFIGDFDGKQFTPANSPRRPPGEPLWADWGRDFYAAVSWSDIPKQDGRRLWLGWMSNWEYAQDVPTSPWRSAMTVARELTLRQTPGGLRLVQQPVKELRSLRGQVTRSSFKRLTSGTSAAASASGDLLDINADIKASRDAVFTLKLKSGANESNDLHVDIQARQMWLDRKNSGKVDFHPKFPGSYSAPVRLVDGRLKLRILADNSSLEIFANDGEAALTSLFIPSSASRLIELHVERGSIGRADFETWPLKPIWKR
ncbi:MAG: glycoside hydrolase family 32 protein [Pedosphaera sp.]|nr:glycoside hydrolase family 32 protein [Pedosphaera sp.]